MNLFEFDIIEVCKITYLIDSTIADNLERCQKADLIMKRKINIHLLK